MSTLHVPLFWHGLAPPTQDPPWQASFVVQAFPSSQALLLSVWVQPEAGSQASSVQGLLSLQSAADVSVPTHDPPLQASPVVQAFPSSQAALLFVLKQPELGSQRSSVQGLLSLQSVADVSTPPHVPPVHTSPVVQAFPSLHELELLAWTQPEAGSQLSSVHALLSSQTTGIAKHPPAGSHPSAVHALLSLQTMGVCVQPVAGSHVSAVQALLSLQSTAAPGLQVPPPHVSPLVHAFPSSQAFELLVWTQPEAESHESSVHGLLSSQLRGVEWQPVAESHVSSVQRFPSLQSTGAPGLQRPPPHVSPVVHAFPSSHVLVLYVWPQPEDGSQLSSVQTLLSSQSSVPVPA